MRVERPAIQFRYWCACGAQALTNPDPRRPCARTCKLWATQAINPNSDRRIQLRRHRNCYPAIQFRYWCACGAQALTTTRPHTPAFHRRFGLPAVLPTLRTFRRFYLRARIPAVEPPVLGTAGRTASRQDRRLNRRFRVPRTGGSTAGRRATSRNILQTIWLLHFPN